MPKKTFIKPLIVLALIAAVLVLYNSYGVAHKSYQQRSFESWLESLEQHHLGAADRKDSAGPRVELLLLSTRQDLPGTWKLQAETGVNTEKILRLLQLAREAEAFEPDEDPDLILEDVVLKIQAGEQIFQTSLSSRKISQNVRLQTFIRLLQIYSMEEKQNSEVTQVASANEDKKSGDVSGEEL